MQIEQLIPWGEWETIIRLCYYKGKRGNKPYDPDTHQVKKGNTWHFGYKTHIGADKDSGLVYTLKVTFANVHDVSVVSELLTGSEESVYGDSGYLGAKKRGDAVVCND